MKATAVLGALLVLATTVLVAEAKTIRVTVQILAYQGGYVFFTTGDAFRVAPNVVIDDAKTGAATTLRLGPRLWARATFDARGEVTELDLSRAPLPAEGSLALVRQFIVALSSPVPNPDLIPPKSSLQTHPIIGKGSLVVVVFKVQVPATTPLDAIVYMTTDTYQWNPQAIPMERIDALHFRVSERLAAGTVFHYLYTRGSFSSIERSAGGLDVKPRTVEVVNVDEQVYNNTVYQWADQGAAGQLLQPNVFPTPYNPAPFPNLPPGIHTPRP